MSQSSGSRSSRKALLKPKTPYAEFPLTPHASGKWAKKIRGKLHYFGNWARRLEGVLIPIEGENGWKPALDEYMKVADALHTGRTPRKEADKDGFAIKDLCNHFLTAKKRKMDAGELTSMMFYDYKFATDFLVEHFGGNRLVDDLSAEDFGTLRAAMAKKWGPVRLTNCITRIRSVFKYGFENGHMERPVRYGSEFDKPSASTLRRHKAKQPAQDARTERDSHATRECFRADEGGDSRGDQLRVRARRLRRVDDRQREPRYRPDRFPATEDGCRQTLPALA